MSKTKEALGRIRDLPAEELGEAAERTRDELFRIKLSSYTNQVQDTASLRKKRRELARILTIMNARSQGREVQAAGTAAAADAPAAKPAKAKPAKAAPAKAKAAAAKPAKKSTKKKEG